MMKEAAAALLANSPFVSFYLLVNESSGLRGYCMKTKLIESKSETTVVVAAVVQYWTSLVKAANWLFLLKSKQNLLQPSYQQCQRN